MSRRLLAAILSLTGFAAASTLAAQLPPQKREAQAPAKKAKKIWTNDDLEALRQSAHVSTGSAESAAAPTGVSSGAAAAEEAGAKPAAGQKDDDPVEKLRKRLTPLRTELDSVETQLRSLRQARSSGSTTGGGIDVSKSPTGVNTEDQVNLLEKRRADLLRQIAEIEDEARRMGIAPGSVR